MNMLTVREVALKWAISEQMVRYHCRAGNIPGASLSGKEWLIPEDAPKPERKEPVSESPIPQLAKKLKNQKNGRNYHGLYDYVQTNLTYSSCRMASNRLTRDQVDMIWKKGKVVSQFEPVKVSDCIETLNHCVCVDYIIDHAMEPITQKFIKKLHCLLMAGSVDERLKKVVPGEFRPNEYKVTGRELPPACTIPGSLREIINEYEEIPDTQLGDILNFHVEFEMIAPFQDGNGRIGRLIMFKECLRHDIMPFIIDDKRRSRYHEGIRKWSGRRKALTTVVNEVQEYFERQITKSVSQMQALGVDLATIQSIVGHADVDMTKHYLHVQESIRQEAIAKFSQAFYAPDTEHHYLDLVKTS